VGRVSKKAGSISAMNTVDLNDIQVRLTKARSNPLRSQILDLIGCEPLSAYELEQLVRQPIKRVSVHLKVLRDLDLIEANHRELVGKREKTSYRPHPDVAMSLAAEAGRDKVGDGGVASVRLLDLLQPATTAIVANPTDLGMSQRMTARTVTLDEIACDEVAGLVDSTRAQILNIEKQAAMRIASAGARLATVSILCLESWRE
jgi:DNA-binding transcriptional ArsR family regulator